MSSDLTVCTEELIVCAQQGSSTAREAVVSMYQPLLKSLAKRVCSDWTNMDELVQAGNVGLLRALQRYDPSQETKLITYAVPWILGEMRSTVRATACGMYSLDEAVGREDSTLYDMLDGGFPVEIAHIDLMLSLSKLKRDEQILLCLRYFRDKTQKESAQILGKSQAQISKAERHALDTLRIMLS